MEFWVLLVGALGVILVGSSVLVGIQMYRFGGDAHRRDTRQSLAILGVWIFGEWVFWRITNVFTLGAAGFFIALAFYGVLVFMGYETAERERLAPSAAGGAPELKGFHYPDDVGGDGE